MSFGARGGESKCLQVCSEGVVEILATAAREEPGQFRTLVPTLYFQDKRRDIYDRRRLFTSSVGPVCHLTLQFLQLATM